jgi:hypothetical protein
MLLTSDGNTAIVTAAIAVPDILTKRFNLQFYNSIHHFHV